ncbi:MAG: DUF4174 domain-containing protein [Phycisphaeraceae bacterium]|nr:DUF4174 domain-containing protein [Phycisphaeraceae bacterium]
MMKHLGVLILGFLAPLAGCHERDGDESSSGRWDRGPSRSAARADRVGEAAFMEQFKWEYRPVIVFAPEVDEDRLSAQMNRLAEAEAGLIERDILVVPVIGPVAAVQRDGQAIAYRVGDVLRRRFGVDRKAFAVVLVGKDGQGKRIDREVVDAAELFETIDAMPMRRTEMLRAR